MSQKKTFVPLLVVLKVVFGTLSIYIVIMIVKTQLTKVLKHPNNYFVRSGNLLKLLKGTFFRKPIFLSTTLPDQVKYKSNVVLTTGTKNIHNFSI